MSLAARWFSVLTSNLQGLAEHGLTNGSRVEVIDVLPYPDTQPHEVKILDEGRLIIFLRPPIVIVRPKRLDEALLQPEFTLQGLTPGLIPVRPIKETVKVRMQGTTLRVNRSQLPMTGAKAITDYKAQGETYHRIIMDIHNVNAPASAYVMASRVGNSERLHILREFKDEKLTTPFQPALQSALDDLDRTN